MRVADERPAISVGRPHIRMPHHVRGRLGMVTELIGPFRDPKRLATGGDVLPMQVPSRVRLCQADLSPGRAMAVCVDLGIDLARDCMIGTAVPAA